MEDANRFARHAMVKLEANINNDATTGCNTPAAAKLMPNKL
jgi:hypothetical protein